jgi:hypothetical protein
MANTKIKMSVLCGELNVSQEFTVPYNPEQNDMAERLNRTLCEMVRNIAKKYWA